MSENEVAAANVIAEASKDESTVNSGEAAVKPTDASPEAAPTENGVVENGAETQKDGGAVENKESGAENEKPTENGADEPAAAGEPAAADEPAAAGEPEQAEQAEQAPEEPPYVLEIEDEGKRVLVTGASGYVGAWVVKKLVDTDKFHVRAHVRSLAEEAGSDVEHLKSMGTEESKYGAPELVAANLLEEGDWAGAVKDCDYVIHCATSVVYDVVDDDIVKAAVEGTMNVLKACQAAGTVKRVVHVSSIQALTGDFDLLTDPNQVFSDDTALADEETHTKTSYPLSKIRSEKAAKDYVEGLEEDKKFELVIIHPTAVMGPSISPKWNPNFEIIRVMMQRETSFLGRVGVAYCDVRDVATSCVRAMLIGEAKATGCITYTKTAYMKEVALILQKEFKKLGYSIPTITVPNAAVKLRALMGSKPAKKLLYLAKAAIKVDAKHMKSILHVDATPFEQTIVDMAHSLLEHGHVRRSKKHTTSLQPAPEESQATAEDGAAAGDGAADKKEAEPTINGEASPETDGDGKTEEPKTNGDEIASSDADKEPVVQPNGSATQPTEEKKEEAIPVVVNAEIAAQ